MNAVEIEAKVREVICHHLELPPERVTVETSFNQDMKVDSLTVIELMLQLEQQFGITVPDDEAYKIKTVGDLVQLIHARQ